jgi:hypothetical protein
MTCNKEQGFYEANPGTELSIQQITLNEPTENSKGLRFGNYVQIRDIIDEEFQALLAGDKDAQGRSMRWSSGATPCCGSSRRRWRQLTAALPAWGPAAAGPPHWDGRMKRTIFGGAPALAAPGARSS